MSKIENILRNINEDKEERKQFIDNLANLMTGLLTADPMASLHSLKLLCHSDVYNKFTKDLKMSNTTYREIYKDIQKVLQDNIPVVD